MRRLTYVVGPTLSVAAAALAIAGCGGDPDPSAHTPRPVVLAAASLTKVFPKIDPAARYTFAGSDTIEAEVEQGAPADVFAAASSEQPAALYARGLVEKPVEFATNQLVLIVPKDNPAQISSVADLIRPGVKLVICAATVPCGGYARTALARLGIARAAMRNVVSQTTDVTQTVAEVGLGQADAGFVYITDAAAARGKVRVVRLPARAEPQAEDYIAVVKSSRVPSAARAFVARVLSAAGRAKLRAAGFGAP